MGMPSWTVFMALFSTALAMTTPGVSTGTAEPASTSIPPITTTTMPTVTSTVSQIEADVTNQTIANPISETVTRSPADDETSTEAASSNTEDTTITYSQLSTSSSGSSTTDNQGDIGSSSPDVIESTTQPHTTTETMEPERTTNSSIVTEEDVTTKTDVVHVTSGVTSGVSDNINVTSTTDDSTAMTTSTPSVYSTTSEVTMTSFMSTEDTSSTSMQSERSSPAAINETETTPDIMTTTSSYNDMITNETIVPNKTDSGTSIAEDITNLSTTTPIIALHKKLTFKFVLSGNCTALSESNFTLTNLFALLKLSIEAELDITNWNITVFNETCDNDNITALFSIFTFDETETIKSLSVLNNVSFSVINDTVNIHLIDVLLISSEEVHMTTTTTTKMIPKVKDSIFKLTFEGDCYILLPELRSYETTKNAGNVTNYEQTTSKPVVSSSSIQNINSSLVSNETTNESNNTEELKQKETSVPVLFNEKLANLSTVEQFKSAFDSAIENMFNDLNLSVVFSTSNITCGSVVLYLTVYNTSENPEIDSAIKKLTDLNLVIYVKDGDNNYHKYSLSKVDTMSSPWLPTTVAMQPTTTQKTRIETEEGLNEVEIIVIIVFGVIGSCLLLFIIGFIIYRCYITRNSKTFTLTDTPNSELRLEDFTLTKLNRPVPIYTDQGVIMPPASVKVYNKGPSMPYKQTVPYNNPMYLQENNGKYNSNRNSGVDHLHRTSTENLVPKSQPQSSPGIENPSFSSDDILDSGSNTSTDLPYDGKVEPNVRAEGMERF